MRGMALALVMFIAGSAHSVSASKAEVTPVQKVIQLMEGMLEKGNKLFLKAGCRWYGICTKWVESLLFEMIL